jgi:hypothetical protein
MYNFIQNAAHRLYNFELYKVFYLNKMNMQIKSREMVFTWVVVLTYFRVML